MNLLAKLTVTPLLYLCGALLIACIGLGGALKVQASSVNVAQSERDTARSQRDAVASERETWRTRAGDLAAANAGFGEALDAVRVELREAQAETRRVDEAGRQAIAAANAEAKDAERTLAAFTAQFQAESRRPACSQALIALEAACPALSGY